MEFTQIRNITSFKFLNLTLSVSTIKNSNCNNIWCDTIFFKLMFKMSLKWQRRHKIKKGKGNKMVRRRETVKHKHEIGS